MDYEKKYKEAIKKAKSKIKNDKDHVLYEDDIIDIFPELAESKDERIRKRIIHALHGDVLEMSEIKEAVDWLEKQGEQKHIEDRPAFEIGDTITDGNSVFTIVDIKDSHYIADDGDKVCFYVVHRYYTPYKEQKPTDKVEPKFKVGDIISNGISEVKIVSIDKNYYIVTNDEIENDANVCNWVIYFKNQDDWKLIEQKTADKVEPKFKAGDWVVCNNGPHHIFQVIERSWPNAKYRNINGIEILLNVFTLDKQYHLWTIQDAKDGDVLYMDNGLSTCTFIYKSIDNVIIQKYASYNKFGFEGTTYLVLNDGYVCPATKEQRDLLFQKMKEAGYEWDAEKKELKKSESYSLRSIIKDEPSPAIKKVVDSLTAWSEEDKEYMKSLLDIINGTPSLTPSEVECHKDWLNSLKGRIQSQLKQEWSEEDEVALGDALWCCKQARTIAKDENDMGNLWCAERWLKSLKERYTWKPNKEQMVTLEYYMHTLVCDSYKETLFGLYQDLKKLREE